ncbi:WAS/WASL-interacting protein family member 3-like [Panicum virgatum]|uniref:WAS/WASL-interacting protein family member 3-like n=1 Tax=Panicum virgatum TaxID=38727 RepID=UPI0019D52614|nr:WAS/WASL-interacting protein family member 3-like [Panicum virgatum]
MTMSRPAEGDSSTNGDSKMMYMSNGPHLSFPRHPHPPLSPVPTPAPPPPSTPPPPACRPATAAPPPGAPPLVLSHNALAGGIPSGPVRDPLVHLDLRGNRLSGVVPLLPPTLLLQLDDDVAALRPVTGPPLLAPTASVVSVAALQVGRVVVSLFDLLRDPQAQEPLRRLPSSPGTTTLSRHHLIAFAGVQAYLAGLTLAYPIG